MKILLLWAMGVNLRLNTLCTQWFSGVHSKISCDKAILIKTLLWSFHHRIDKLFIL
jgi:hypothetical protein